MIIIIILEKRIRRSYLLIRAVWARRKTFPPGQTIPVASVAVGRRTPGWRRDARSIPSRVPGSSGPRRRRRPAGAAGTPTIRGRNRNLRRRRCHRCVCGFLRRRRRTTTTCRRPIRSRATFSNSRTNCCCDGTRGATNAWRPSRHRRHRRGAAVAISRRRLRTGTADGASPGLATRMRSDSSTASTNSRTTRTPNWPSSPRPPPSSSSLPLSSSSRCGRRRPRAVAAADRAALRCKTTCSWPKSFWPRSRSAAAANRSPPVSVSGPTGWPSTVPGRTGPRRFPRRRTAAWWDRLTTDRYKFVLFYLFLYNTQRSSIRRKILNEKKKKEKKPQINIIITWTAVSSRAYIRRARAAVADCVVQESISSRLASHRVI